ncbi:class I SAM-dependent methyltransferase [Pseudonocardia sp. RS11V-5]|uniref:class I SAM-dependent methyltransferase n=1 Tax=Pseudonocardia terrae TaxID=2905831 RepID=UPI001E2C4089|nr:class I SAM-dependent methyltransferase [Pseudonocardia terrae]MCE3556281.1 class I SAM-dependent methyltransferase [Pseudonocardia terrae]
MSVPERVVWAVDLLDPWPDERILEIGPGPGVAADLVCRRGARLLAVDRSAVAVERTLRRNAAHVASGLLEVRAAELAALDLPAGGFDGAFSVDVNVFWTRSPAAELAVLHSALRPGGRLHVCFGPTGPQPPDRITTAVGGALRAAGFDDVSVRSEPTGLAVSGFRAGGISGR